MSLNIFQFKSLEYRVSEYTADPGSVPSTCGCATDGLIDAGSGLLMSVTFQLHLKGALKPEVTSRLSEAYLAKLG